MDGGSPLPEAKASGFNSVVKVLRQMLPAPAFEQLVRALPKETLELVERPPMPVTWIPAQRWADLVSTAYRLPFAADENKVTELGRQAMLGDLKTLYRIFIRMLSPAFVIERSSKLWLTYNRNNGQLRAERTGDQSCDIHYEGVVAVYPGFWSYQRGAIMAVLEATGYQHTDVKLKKGGRDGNTVFSTSWRD